VQERNLYFVTGQEWNFWPQLEKIAGFERGFVIQRFEQIEEGAS